MIHHNLDPYPDSKEKSPLYINEPWLFDKTLISMDQIVMEKAGEPTKVRRGVSELCS